MEQFIYSITSRPCVTAFFIRPIPPNSPTIYIPLILVSKFGVRDGMSTPLVSVPKTNFIAPTGHAMAQAPWPIHLDALIRLAFPFTRPIISCSGHDFTQAPLPMHVDG